MRWITGTKELFRRKKKATPATENGASQASPGMVESTRENPVNTAVDVQPLHSFPDGVLELHTCSDATVDICFIHGLTGDRRSTWTAPGQTVPWPQSLLPQKLERARILTYGYDAYVVRKSTAETNRLIDHATNLLADLAACRAKSPRPLIFVAHSLGGLVCKQALSMSRHHPEKHIREIFDSTKGIIFLGTPHRGAWIADLAAFPASIFGMVKSTNTSLLRVLQTDDQFLESIQITFWDMIRSLEDSRRIQTTCFFEELPVIGQRPVVTKASATLEGQNSLSIHANHSNMVKFASIEDNGFQRVVAVLVRWESEIGSSFEHYLGLALKNIRLLHNMFEGSRKIVLHKDNEEMRPHQGAFNLTLLLLITGKQKLEVVCESLLSLLHFLSRDELNELLDNKKLWFRLGLRTELRGRAADNVHDIEKSTKLVCNSLRQMRKVLAMPNEPKSRPGSPKYLTHQEEFMEKWRKEQERHEQTYKIFIEYLSEEIERLSEFVIGDEGLGATPKVRKPSDKAMRYWLDLRNHTERLFNLINVGTNPTCPAHSHLVRLRLQIPTHYQVDPERPQFLYSFQVKAENASGYTWRDVDILSIRQSVCPSDTFSSSIDGKKTRFKLPEERGTPFHGKRETCESNMEIYNICNTLQNESWQGGCLGILLDSGWHYHVHDAERQSNDLDATSVRVLLSSWTQTNHLPLRQRRLIAFALVSGVVQLYDTPWLDDYWTIDDVSVDLQDQTRIYTKNHQTVSQPWIRNPSLFSLAKALIELTYGGPLSSLRKPEDGNTNDSETLWRTANRLTGDMQKGRKSAGMPVQAITWCMHPHSSNYSWALSSADFRRQYIVDVLLPLYQENEELFGNALA
ncbi:hypothetical protein CcaCcLH18_06304 [Colletotrichum camelliae]|nr:hypothetical protein CcaCcLH18_06304 [Colletotrichum camelliae]